MTQNAPADNSPSTSQSSRRGGSVWEIYFPASSTEHRDSIYIASFPEILYFWPSILVFFICAFFQGAVGVDPTIIGWAAVLTIILNLLILVQDFDQKKFTIFILIFFALILGVWIINLYGFTFLKNAAHWILSFEPQFSTDAYILLGSSLAVLFIWGVSTPLFSYWKFEQNEFIHYSQPIGKDMSIARTGCTVYKEIPDVLECILGFGAGQLVIRKDNQILATIKHIPFLGSRMRAIEHMLSETRVIVEQETR